MVGLFEASSGQFLVCKREDKNWAVIKPWLFDVIGYIWFNYIQRGTRG